MSTPSVTYNYRPPDFSWQHIALSWSGHFGNSNLQSTITGSSYPMPQSGGRGNRVSDANNMFTLGNRPQGNSSYFKGWMDDFSVSESRLHPSEVDGMYTASPETNATIFRYGCLQRLRPRSGRQTRLMKMEPRLREQILLQWPGTLYHVPCLRSCL